MEKGMKRLRFFVGLSFVLSLSACLNDTIRPDILQDYTPKMVINAVLTADSTVSIRLTQSLPVVDSTYPTLVQNATVTYESATGADGSFTYDPISQTYITNKVFVPGEIFRLRGEHPTLPTVVSEVRMPDKVESQASLTLDGGVDTSGLSGDLLTLTVNDPGGQKNYYRLRVLYNNGVRFIPFSYPRADPSFADYNSLVLEDNSVLFTDELFEGQQKTILSVAVNSLTAGISGDKYMIEFASVSSDYYDYFISLDRAIDAKEVTFQGGFNNAVVIHSNIDNGLGILATESRSNFILR
jgi:hypothetical protein